MNVSDGTIKGDGRIDTLSQNSTVFAEYDGNDVLSAYTVFGNSIDETVMRVNQKGQAPFRQ